MRKRGECAATKPTKWRYVMNQIVKPSDRRFGWELFGDFDDLVNQVPVLGAVAK